MALAPSTTSEKIKSIQGEQQAAQQDTLWATDAQVDKWAQKAEPGVLECRERGRHLFPSIRQTGLSFSRVHTEGWMIRLVGCDCCRRPDGVARVIRTEYWDVRSYRGKVTRATLISAHLNYADPSYLGQRGGGRMKTKQIRNSLGTQALKGEEIRVLRRDTMARGAGSDKSNTSTQETA